MKLSDVAEGLGVENQLGKYAGIDITDVGCDSRVAIKGGLFVAIKGVNQDGSRFISQAVSKGAKVIVSEERVRLSDPETCCLRVENSRLAIARAAANFYKHPASGMKITGITGTDGKTTTAYLIERLLKTAGFSPGVIGTVEHRFAGKALASGNTTPGPVELQKLFFEMASAGVNYVVMEVSSHSLDQSRVAGVPFKYAVFTNISGDHLDYHKTFEEYFSAKAGLFQGLPVEACAVINRDSPYSKQLIDICGAAVFTYGLDSHPVDLSAANISLGVDGTVFDLSFKGEQLRVSTPLVGRHNIYNILAAAAVGVKEGFSLDMVKKGIEEMPGVPGRLEPVKCGQDFFVFVDYAHTENALSNVLTSLRRVARGKIIAVFGCGGMRDKSKRPAMGRAATELSDFCFITSDNPRSEPPEEIINDIVAGIRKTNYKVIPGREDAINEALKHACKGDIVLIAGKGHERFQIYGKEKVEFDDRKVAEKFLRGL